MPCVHRKDPADTEFCTCTQDGTYARINWRTNTCEQEQACVCMNTSCALTNEHRMVFFDILKLFSTKTHPRPVPTLPKVSGFQREGENEEEDEGQIVRE